MEIKNKSAESLQPVQSNCNFNKEYTLTTARQQYFSEITDKNINNSQTLFAVVEKNSQNHLKKFTPELFSTEKCNEFLCFFSGKKTNQ